MGYIEGGWVGVVIGVLGVCLFYFLFKLFGNVRCTGVCDAFIHGELVQKLYSTHVAGNLL